MAVKLAIALAAAVLGAAILATVASIYVARENDWRRRTW